MRRLTIAGFSLGTEIIIFLETAVKTRRCLFSTYLIHSRAKITLFIQHFRKVYKAASFGSKNVHIHIACKVSSRLEFQVGYLNYSKTLTYPLKKGTVERKYSDDFDLTEDL